MGRMTGLSPAKPVLACLSIACLLLQPAGSVALLGGGTWTQQEDFPGSARHAAAGFALLDKGYLGTGFDGRFRSDFWEYHGTSDVWSRRADFPGGPRRGALGVSDGIKGYLGTGYYDPDNQPNGNEVFHRDFWEYDPVEDAWTRKADFPGEGRRGAVGFAIGTKLYVGLGWSGVPPAVRFHRDVWVYDSLTDEWNPRAPLGGAGRADAVGFSVGAKGFVATGWAPGAFFRDVWEFDPLAGADLDGDGVPDGSWSPKRAFGGAARADAVAFTIAARAYLGTGMDGQGRFFGDLWEYDVLSDRWATMASLPGPPRGEAVGFAIPALSGPLGVGHVATGGTPGANVRDLWAFRP